jgi:uncharacterized membrane protein
MKKSLVLGTIAAIAASLGHWVTAPSPVRAGEICNYRNVDLYAATAYQNADEVWISTGWWRIIPGDCLAYPDNLATFLKVDEHVSPVRPLDDKVASTQACVVNDWFLSFNAVSPKACAESDGSLVTFRSAQGARELIKE